MTAQWDLIEAAKKLGYTCAKSHKGHLRFLHPKLDTPIFASATPSDHRGHKNALATLRRALREQ